MDQHPESRRRTLSDNPPVETEHLYESRRVLPMASSNEKLMQVLVTPQDLDQTPVQYSTHQQLRAQEYI